MKPVAANLLVTGFEPFGGEDVNPAWEICRDLPEAIGASRVHVLQVPCEFRAAIEVVAAEIERLEPAIVLSLGQAGGRAAMSVERVAINVDDARIDDNAGNAPIDEPVASGGPAAYFATLPVKAMVAAMREAGVPAIVSNTAGTFVCNHILYSLMDIIETHPRRMRGGFLHIPYVPEQAVRLGGAPSMALADIVRGIEIILTVSAARVSDVHTAEGRIS